MRQLGWLVGAPLALLRFLRQQTPIEEVEAAGPPRPLPADEPDRAHREDDRAVGPAVDRLYGATIEAPVLSAERLLAIVAADPNVIAPAEVLRFEKTGCRGRGLEEGDELLIRMAGPWNGPTRVTGRWREGFRLAGVRGHPQVGQLELRVRDRDGGIAIEIQTHERAAGIAFHLLWRIGLIRRMQDYTWATMIGKAAQLAGGRPPERIRLRRSTGARGG